ncbi:hypothetical protein M378DRAFT_165285, partial [Amanita muscaria Koide BX008]
MTTKKIRTRGFTYCFFFQLESFNLDATKYPDPERLMPERFVNTDRTLMMTQQVIISVSEDA